MGKLISIFQKERKEKEIRYILSIDGGGMRGVIPAYILSRLDEILKNLGDKRPLYSHFDLVAGTSTGALLSLGLTSPLKDNDLEKDTLDPYPVYQKYKKGIFRKEERILKGLIEVNANPSCLLDIYLKHGERIFPHSIMNVIGQLFQVKYDVRPYESFLKEKLADIALEEALVPTIVISYDCPNGRPFIFKSYDAHGFLAREAARASTAAPLYFPPALLRDRETGEDLVLSDGGLVANNPAMIAYIEAKKLYPEANEFRMLSLSTCKRPYSFDPSKTSGGATVWMTSITRIYSNAQENLAESMMKNLKDVKYTRIYSEILDRRIALDDTSKESMTTLLDGAEKVYEMQEDEIRSYAMELSEKETSNAVKLRKSGMLTYKDGINQYSL